MSQLHSGEFAGGVLGIDEAGRGCLIGPMALAGFLVKGPDEFRLLGDLGVNDSKKLSPARREEIYLGLANFSPKAVFFSPQEIDAVNLNELEISGVRDLCRKFSPEVLIFDAPVNPGGIGRLLGRLRLLVGPGTKIILENRADEKYPACMAASIVAKVNRDREIKKLHETFGDFGSGYPSDPKTRNFVANLNGRWGAFEPHIRKKWSTIRSLRQKGPPVVIPAKAGRSQSLAELEAPGALIRNPAWTPAFAGVAQAAGGKDKNGD